ncbi:2'-5' RNA ligase family protein [Sphingomonas edaphi]|uniref:2'-5' RNA ligase family protein n=1 Tax=Sphingomonas edaphi TaxID=2315689 RepID=UPI001F41785F|nr:2'-5' RNA ligase family protein [Sphingomonas edaphi]
MAGTITGPLIVTANLGDADFAWLNGLRIKHFPPERNQLPAHLTMFHALPPSVEDEAKHELSRHASGTRPQALVAGLMNLGGGVAYRIVSDELESIRNEIAAHFHGMLTAQDAAGWRPHVTVQNKVSNRIALTLLADLERDFRPRPLVLTGLSLHRYLGGPWEPIAQYPFRGG